MLLFVCGINSGKAPSEKLFFQEQLGLESQSRGKIVCVDQVWVNMKKKRSKDEYFASGELSRAAI